MSITTNVVSSNSTHGEMFSIQHYVIYFVSDLGRVGGFLRVLLSPPPITKTVRHEYNGNIVDSGAKHSPQHPEMTLADIGNMVDALWLAWSKRLLNDLTFQSVYFKRTS